MLRSSSWALPLVNLGLCSVVLRYSAVLEDAELPRLGSALVVWKLNVLDDGVLSEHYRPYIKPK